MKRRHDDWMEDDFNNLTPLGNKVQNGRDGREYLRYKEWLKEQRLLDEAFKKQHPDYNGS